MGLMELVYKAVRGTVEEQVQRALDAFGQSQVVPPSEPKPPESQEPKNAPVPSFEVVDAVFPPSDPSTVPGAAPLLQPEAGGPSSESGSQSTGTASTQEGLASETAQPQQPKPASDPGASDGTVPEAKQTGPSQSAAVSGSPAPPQERPASKQVNGSSPHQPVSSEPGSPANAPASLNLEARNPAGATKSERVETKPGSQDDVVRPEDINTVLELLRNSRTPMRGFDIAERTGIAPWWRLKDVLQKLLQDKKVQQTEDGLFSVRSEAPSAG